MKNDISYSIVDHEGIKVIRIAGSISNSTKKEFEDLIERLSKNSDLILNMQELSIITSAGLNSLISIFVNARKRKRKIMLMGLRDGLRKMIEVMEASQHFIFIDSIEEGQFRIHYS